MTDLARALWGIPVILQAERDSVFPSPERDQRYQDRTTGDVYRYDGSTWGLDVAGGKGGPVFDVRAYGATGDGVTDDTAAIQAVLDAAAAAGSGTVIVPAGTYLHSDLTIASYTTLLGAGWSTVFQKKAGSTYMLSVNPGSGGTADPADNVRGVVIRGVSFVGLAETAFSEHHHMLNLNAVSDVLIEQCQFTAFEGDGIYLGSSNVAATERHNERVTIRDCVFDGVNKENRNAISIIDGDTVTVERCYFTRCSKSTMPGAIDIEPDSNAFARFRAIRLRQLRMDDIGGNVGAIALALPLGQSAMTQAARDITIEDVLIDGCQIGIGLLQVEDKTAAMTPNDVRLQRVTVANCARPFVFDGVKGVTVRDCTFRDSTSSPVVGLTYRCYDVRFVGSTRWERIDTVAGGGFVIADADVVTIDENEFVDCGPVTGGGYAIQFNPGTSSYVTLTRNRFRSPTAGRMAFSVVNSGHTYTPTTNVNRDNVYLDSVDNGAGRFYPYPPNAVSADRGDANVTLVAGTDAEVQRFNTTLTANRTVTVSAAGRFVGDRFRIVRFETAPAAFTLTVNTTAVIPASKNGVVELSWDGTGWKVSGLSSLS